MATRGAPSTTPLRAAVPVPVPGRIVEAVLMNPDLTVIWAFIIAFAVAAYVVMDGFDLGIGILFPRFTVGKERDQAMNAVAPVWAGNEERQSVVAGKGVSVRVGLGGGRHIKN